MKWTQADIHTLHDAAAAGKTRKEIAALMGRSYAAIDDKLRTLGLRSRNQPPPQQRDAADIPCVPKRNYTSGLNVRRVHAAADPAGELDDLILLYPSGNLPFKGAVLTLLQTDRLIAVLTSLRDEAAAEPGPRSSTSPLPQEHAA